MNLIKCSKCGQYYDPGYPSCPNCSGGSMDEESEVTQSYSSFNGGMDLDMDMLGFDPYGGGSGGIDATIGHDTYGGNMEMDGYSDFPGDSMMQQGPSRTATSGFQLAGDYAAPYPNDDEDKTVSYYSVSAQGGGRDTIEPVVGWLVCLKGKNAGQDFRLRTGKNYVGRSDKMDVVLKGENTVSRDRHVIILFEPRQKIFLVQPGESKELAYLNNELILQPQVLKRGDVISAGEVDLLFVPLCSKDGFSWSSHMPGGEWTL